MDLRERVADAIGSADRLAPTDREVWLDQADAALAALGLKDMDAAVDRLCEEMYRQWPVITRVRPQEARAVLEAALGGSH